MKNALPSIWMVYRARPLHEFASAAVPFVRETPCKACLDPSRGPTLNGEIELAKKKARWIGGIEVAATRRNDRLGHGGSEGWKWGKKRMDHCLLGLGNRDTCADLKPAVVDRSLQYVWGFSPKSHHNLSYQREKISNLELEEQQKVLILFPVISIGTSDQRRLVTHSRVPVEMEDGDKAERKMTDYINFPRVMTNLSAIG